MPERFPSTPLQVPAITRPTPDYDTLLFWELVDTIANPERLDYGSPHPDVEHYSGFLLCKEERQDYKTVQRWWASGEVKSQNIWNYNIGYSGESTEHPIYQRTYILRREQEAPPAVAPLPKGHPFTGVWQIGKTNGGTGYDPDTPPVVVVAAPPAGDGHATATARAVVNSRGSVAWIVITFEGSGYITVPAVTIAAPIPSAEIPEPVTALAVAWIQPATARLVKEDLEELSDDDPRRSIFVRLIRIYETLPGPWLPFTRYDLLLGPIQGRRRAVIAAGQIASLTLTAKTTYEARDGSSYVSLEIEETNSTGEGTEQNPAFPITVKDGFDEQRGAFQETSQLVVATGGEVGSEVVAGTLVTKTSYIPVNQFLLRKVIETWTLGAEALVGKEFDEFGGLEASTSTFVAASIAPTNTVALVEGVPTVPHVQSLQPASELVARLTDTIREVGLIVDEIEPVDPRVPNSRARIEYYLVLASTTIPANTTAAGVSSTVYARLRYPKDTNLRIEVKTTYSVPLTFSETRILSYPFPTIFLSWQIRDSGEAHFNRPGFSDNVSCDVTHVFGTTRFTFPEIGAAGVVYPIRIREAQWNIQRFVGHGLTDEDVINYVDPTGLFYFKLPKSTPRREDYLLLAGLMIVPEVAAGGVGPDFTPYEPPYLAPIVTVPPFAHVPQLIGGSSEIWRGEIYQTSLIRTILR